ncbi:MAG: hypothetical protein PHI27_12330 [Eubacteriales bacterium]|nr:hypothetical protein [Eubacteriales bacterium]MDD3883011.1 hypothetical protein [Eubacteriales bacterium]MDD4513881.1 hypothetical protein [Eubacteriales bacterium]
MKKINSIDYGAKAIGIGAVFLIGIPILLTVCNKIVNSPVFQTIRIISLISGAVILAGFGLLLLTELRQDRLINKYYEKNPLADKTPQEILDEHRHFRKER